MSFHNSATLRQVIPYSPVAWATNTFIFMSLYLFMIILYYLQISLQILIQIINID